LGELSRLSCENHNTWIF